MPYRTARETFLASPYQEKFKPIATSPEFEAACQAALLVYVEEQIVQSDPNAACAHHYLTMGARQVLNVLKEIHLKPEPKKEVRVRTLQPPS